MDSQHEINERATLRTPAPERAGGRPGRVDGWALRCVIVVLLWIGVLASFAVTSGTAGASVLGWTTRSTYPPLVSMVTGISCPSTSDCEVVGSFDSSSATILSTTDGGSTWGFQTVPSALLSLTGISCASTKVCEAVGDGFMGGIALGTTNGGTTWTSQTLPSAVNGPPSAISCPSTTDCFATAAETSGATTTDVVVVTTDGGSSWTTQTVPAFSGQFSAISCPTVARCFASSDDYSTNAGGIIATTDGGTTWTSQSVPGGSGPLTAISCPSASVCEVVGDTTTSNGEALGTTDGGTTWSAQTVPAGPGLSGVSCPDTSFCMATGFTRAVATTDGGTTWTDDTLPASLASVLQSSVSCATSSVCELGATRAEGGEVGEFGGTTDGGSTWTAQAAPAGVAHVADVSCPTTSVCFAVSTTPTAGWVVVSTDGGSTWSNESLPSSVASLSVVSCASASTCEAGGTLTSGSGVLLGTTDGGTTWTPQALPVGVGLVTALSCPSTSACFGTAYGVSGATVIATTDGGAIWTAQSVPASATALSGISCASATVCTAVGSVFGASNAPVLIATTDGGTTPWTSQTPPNTISGLQGVSCPSTSVCEAVGSTTTFAPAVIGTTDGGATWAQLGASSGGLPTFEFPAISCPTVSTCEVAAADGTLGTTDGGATWTTQSVPSGVDSLDTISCASTSACVGGAGAPSGSQAETVGAMLLTYGPVSAPVPTVTGLSQNAGPASGGTPVTIFGTGFTGATAVHFGAAAASGLTVNSDTSITATDPAGTGTVDITVTTPGGTSATSSSDRFSYMASAPAAPTHLTATLGVGTVGLSWSAPGSDGGSPITSYTVNGTDTTTSQAITPVTVSGSPPATNADLTGLTAGDAYSFTVSAANTVGTGPASTALAELLPAPYFPVAPARICDTRASNTTECAGQTLAAGGTLKVQVTGNGNVPAGATAVVANVTVTGATAPSFLTAYPDGTTRLVASNLNFTAGETVPNLVTVPLSGSGALDLYNASGKVNVIVDVDGYYGPGSGEGFTSLTPSRICDTRSNGNSTECVGKTLSAGGTLTVQVTGQGGVPSGASAVVANVTATGGTAPSFLTAYPDGTSRPLASNLNFTAGQSVPNRVIIPLSSSGALDIYNASGSVNAIVDVDGYYSSATSGYFEPVAPDRICDTRSNGNSTGCVGKTLSAGGTLNVQVSGNGGVPSGAAAVVGNVTATGASAQSFLTVYPADAASRPLASDLNFVAGESVPNLCVAKLSSTGALDIYNASGSVNALVDVAGWFTP